MSNKSQPNYVDMPDVKLSTVVRAARIAAIMADILLLIQTWRVTFRPARDARRMIRAKASCTYLLLRDGT